MKLEEIKQLSNTELKRLYKKRLREYRNGERISNFIEGKFLVEWNRICEDVINLELELKDRGLYYGMYKPV